MKGYSFNMLLYHLCIFFGEVYAKFFCSFLKFLHCMLLLFSHQVVFDSFFKNLHCMLLFSHQVVFDSFAAPWTVAHQARLLEWVAISFSRESSPPRDRTQSSALQADALNSEPPGKSHPFVQGISGSTNAL